MNKSIIKIFTLALVLVFAAATGVDAQKIGHMSSQAVFLEMPDTKSAQQQLEDYRKQLGAKIDGRQKALQQKIQENSVKAQKGELTPNEIKTIEEQIQKEGTSIDQEIKTLEQQYGKRELELLQPLEKKFNDAVKQVADENGYTYIMETATLLHARNEDNITDKVKAKLGM